MLNFLRKHNVIGALGGWIWLLVTIVPIYYIVITSLKPQSEFYTTNPLIPSMPSFEAYGRSDH